MLGESFNFGYCKDFSTSTEKNDSQNTGSFIYTIDNHTSVLGMREVVKTKRVRSIERHELLQNLSQHDKSATNVKNSSLIVFPAQSNFCGFKYPLKLVSIIQRNGLIENQCFDSSTDWYVAIDSACFASTCPLDLNKYQADFVCISFYKIFGYPTGLGCLLVSKRGEQVLKKRYYGGGTVKVALAKQNWHKKKDGSVHDCFEDGTISYLSILSLLSGFKTLERLVPAKNNCTTMERISYHVFSIARYFYINGNLLKHANGTKVISFFCETDYKSFHQQGGICSFLLVNEKNEFIGFTEVNQIAQLSNIILRTGCFCNPGACQRYLKMTDELVYTHFKSGHVCGDEIDIVNGTPTGVIRASFGYMTSYADIDHLLKVINDCFIYKKKINKDNQSEKSGLINIQNENNDIYAGAMNDTSDKRKEILLKEINIFPIKSCGKFRVDHWPLTKRGLKYDREWLIVRNDGLALTQKQNSNLCLIKPKIIGSFLLLTYPNSVDCKILLELDSSNTLKVPLCHSKVCNDNIEGIDCGEEVAAWLSNVLKTPGLRLIKQSFSKKRIFSQKYDNKEISLVNQAQFLVINRSSIRWLAKKVNEWDDIDFDCDELKLDCITDRFRANLVIETKMEFEESHIKSIFFDKIALQYESPCTRCQMICIDQRTGLKSKEPLRTLVQALEGKIKFGVYFSLQENNCVSNDDSLRLVSGTLRYA